MANKSYWIWYDGEYEIYHSMKLNLRRQEYGADYPPPWNVHTPYVTATFMKTFTSNEDGYLVAHTIGKGYVKVDHVRYPMGVRVEIPAGTHTVNAVVSNENGLCALYLDSDVCPSDADFYANHGAGDFLPACWEPYYDALDKNPEQFPFVYEPQYPVSVEETADGMLYDFGRETFGYLNIADADPSASMCVVYGESREEAFDEVWAVNRETICGQTAYRLTQRAFRYIRIIGATPVLQISMDYEYLPLEKKGTFRCDNDLFNQVYDMCLYTFHLNCREAFLDGIKRDRWVWSGDAYQSQRINAYCFADAAINRRTAIGLVGRAPVEQHPNTIIDYSFLWIIGLYEHYMTYGDAEYLRRMWHITRKLLEFCETRLNADGFIEGVGNDWTFIDWSDIDKTGAVCAEQMLLAATYRYMDRIAETIGADRADFSAKADAMVKKINEAYWDAEKGAFIDSYVSGKRNVTRHANIFAVMYGIATEAQKASILVNVLKNDAVTKITTPYFEGYELDVLAKYGDFAALESMMESYWGEMIRLGATTIWEAFDPTQTGVEHYGMYGKPYDKSLCHAWGAGPIYLFGRYYLGVYPTAPGFETFRVEPNLGGLQSISGIVPANGAEVRVSLDADELRVTATRDGGTLAWEGKEYVLAKDCELVIKR